MYAFVRSRKRCYTSLELHSAKADEIILSKDFRNKYYIGKVENYKSDECKDFPEKKKEIWADLKSHGICAFDKKIIQ